MKALATILWLALFALVYGWASGEDRADFLTRQTARVAVFYWGLACALMLHAGLSSLSRWLWTLACGAYLIHVATAFEQVHLWRHAKAFQHVEETSGFGPGLFVSYGFTLLWTVDVLVWWWQPKVYRTRNRRWTYAIHGFTAFVVFNGTVVYETGFIRWAGVGLFVILGLFWWRRTQKISP